MSYTEHDETMDSRSLDGITASGAAESSPVGVSQEAPGVERADPAGDRTEGIAPVLEAGTEEEATAPAAQAEGGGLDPPEAPLPSGESEQTGEAGPETPVEEKPKRKRVSRKKAADSPEDTSGGEAAGEAAQASEEEDTSSGASDDLSAQGGDTPEHDDDEDLETDAFVLSDGGEEMPPTPLEGTGDDDTADAPMEGPEPAPSPKARPARRTASAAKTANRPKKEFTSRPLKDKPTLLSLDLNKLDEDLSEEERNEWNAIYASYRSKSILTGRIMGIDTHSFTVRNRETRQTERRKMLCAVIINYRVKVLIPETEVWYPGQERPPYVLRNMSGAETDYIILDVDREGGVAIGSRRMALAAQRHFFDTIKGGRSIGEVHRAAAPGLGTTLRYASYRSKSILTGRIMGIDTHSFTVRNRETRQTERRKMLCAVIINYRVKVLIPETEVWYPGQERPPYVLRNMSGAETDYIILDVDREGGVAIGSRRMALAAQRHFFDTIKGGRSIGEKLTCRVLAVGPRRCLVECGGRDMSLSQKDLTYIATPDLRTRYHPGQTLNCVLKEYDRREGQFWVSVKDTVDNPFFGALRRHPIGSRRQAVISGKYGGGVFCTLSDETVCLCHYSTLHSDLDFHVGDTVILAIKQFDYERSLIYGRILSKW